MPTEERPLLESVDVVSSTRVRVLRNYDLHSKQTSTEESEIKRLFDGLVLLASIKEG